MTARCAAQPDDAVAVVHLAGRAVAAATCEQRCPRGDHRRDAPPAFLEHTPAHYEARRMLAAVLLSQHRFGEAIAEANRARAADPRDAWNYGAIGDGYMELGDYDRAFEAFDRMGQLAPGPSAYARSSYALEIKGDLDGALEFMRMAADGTTPNDPESQAWHFAQVGDLLMQLGRHRRGARCNSNAPPQRFRIIRLRSSALARAEDRRWRLVSGEAAAARRLAKAPTPDLAISSAISPKRSAITMGAAPYFRVAEQIERAALGERSAAASGAREILRRTRSQYRRSGEPGRRSCAIATGHCHDGHLALAYLKAGQLADARRASDDALRTGSRDARLLWHAAEIRAAAGEPRSRVGTAAKDSCSSTRLAMCACKSGSEPSFKFSINFLCCLRSARRICLRAKAGTFSASAACVNNVRGDAAFTGSKTCLEITSAKRSWKKFRDLRQRREAARESAAEDGEGRTSEELREAFESHLEETEGQVTRLERVFDCSTRSRAASTAPASRAYRRRQRRPSGRHGGFRAWTPA